VSARLKRKAKKGEFVLQNRDRAGLLLLWSKCKELPRHLTMAVQDSLSTPDGAPIVSFGECKTRAQLGRQD
jgi:hypothetical protein